MQAKICSFYLGYFSLAYETFLNEGRQEKIGESKSLIDMRDKIQKIREGKKEEIHDKTKDEFYSRLVPARSENFGYDDVRKAMLFLADVFADKVKNYAANEE